MENEKRNKTYILLGLLLSVAGITIGFATISKNLVVQSNTMVEPNAGDFRVLFSSSPIALATDPIQPVKTSQDIEAADAIIDNSETPVIKDLFAKFTNVGQTVIYTFYVYNDGKYDAYLNSVIFAQESGALEQFKTCKALQGTSQELVDRACEGISLNVKIGSELPTNTSHQSIDGHLLSPHTSDVVIVTIHYSEESVLPKGPFLVSFGDIVLNYDLID